MSWVYKGNGGGGSWGDSSGWNIKVGPFNIGGSVSDTGKASVRLPSLIPGAAGPSLPIPGSWAQSAIDKNRPKPKVYQTVVPGDAGHLWNSMADWNNVVNAYKSQADAQNAEKWAGLESQLSSLYSDASQKKIAVDFSGLKNGIDNQLAAQLAQSRNMAGGLDDQYYTNAANSARVLFDTLNAGADRDEAYTRAQYDFIQRALDEARAQADTTLKEGGQVRDDNIRNIAAQSGAAGSYFSSGRLADDSRQNQIYGIVGERVGQAKTQAQREWEQARAELDKHLGDLGDQRQKFRLDLWDTTLGANTNKEKAKIERWNAEMRSQAEQKQRQLDQQMQSQQLAAFYKGIQQQADAIRFMQAVADFNNRQNAWYSAIAAGYRPNQPSGAVGPSYNNPAPLAQQQRAAIDKRRR